MSLRVLVVHDEFDACKLLQSVFTTAGLRTVCERGARGATDGKARRDIAMPERDGYQLVRDMRALSADEVGKAPALALTTFARSADARADRWLAIEPHELIVTLARLAAVTGGKPVRNRHSRTRPSAGFV